MTRQRKKIVLYAFIILIVPVLFASYNDNDVEPSSPQLKQHLATEPPSNPYWDDLLDNYTESMQKILDETGIPGGSIAIVKDTTVIFSRGFGVKMMGQKDLVDKNTVFRIGSVSKPMAAMLTAILVGDSILQWDDPVVNYLPDFKLKSSDQTPCLTIRNVLSHTTGLPYHTFTTLVEDGIDLPTMLQRIEEVNCGLVGETYSYQNVAFSLIGEIIEKATGKTYEEVLAEKVFLPLNMTNASTSYEGIFYNKNIAQPHLHKSKKWKPIRISDKYYNVAPAGGVNASATDMAKWMKALLGIRQDVVTTASLQQIYTPVIKANAKNRSYRQVNKITGSYYGLGWRVLHFPKDTLIYHGGYVNGYRSEVAIYPKDNLAICILANAPGKFTDTGIPVFLKMYLQERRAIAEWENRQHIMLQVKHKAFEILP